MNFKRLSVGLALAAALASLPIIYAQSTTTDQSGTSLLTDTNVDWSSLSDAQIELLAIEQVTPTPYSQLSESDQVGGTFWSAQHSPVSSEPWPPLPADLGQLSVWSLSTNNQDQGIFLLDDLSVNYNSSSTTTTQTAGTIQTLVVLQSKTPVWDLSLRTFAGRKANNEQATTAAFQCRGEGEDSETAFAGR